MLDFEFSGKLVNPNQTFSKAKIKKGMTITSLIKSNLTWQHIYEEVCTNRQDCGCSEPECSTKAFWTKISNMQKSVENLTLKKN
jgi:hypothetical protein